MSDEPNENDREAAAEANPEAALIYESNPKHSEPWQIGKRGSLCEPEVRPLAAALLRESVLWEGKRYAIHQGKAYCAQEHEPNRWHPLSDRMARSPFEADVTMDSRTAPE